MNTWHELSQYNVSMAKDRYGELERHRVDQVDELHYPTRMRIEEIREERELARLTGEVWE